MSMAEISLVGLVTVVVHEGGVAADVGDQERPDVGVIGARVGKTLLLTLADHRRLCARPVIRS
jgi:hypothetical protein